MNEKRSDYLYGDPNQKYTNLAYQAQYIESHLGDTTKTGKKLKGHWPKERSWTTNWMGMKNKEVPATKIGIN